MLYEIPILAALFYLGTEIPTPPQEAATYVLVLLLAWVVTVWSLFSRKKVVFGYQMEERDKQLEKFMAVLENIEQLARNVTDVAESQTRIEELHVVFADSMEKLVKAHRAAAKKNKSGDDE